MKRRPSCYVRGAVCVVISCFVVPGSLDAGVAPVTTYHNDLAHTGQYTTETILTPATVASGLFSKRFTYTVDGQVYAQPLYLPNVNVTGKGVHNVVFVATEHDSVYAFDADSNEGGDQPLWQRSVINPGAGITTVPYTDTWDAYGSGPCMDLVPEIGITSMPVIDPSTGTLYVLARTKEPDGSGGYDYVQRLHALSTASGKDAHAPVVVQASVPGTGDGTSSPTTIKFDPLFQHQRSGLVLSHGVVYAGWASHCDGSPNQDPNYPGNTAFYRSWVIGFSASSPTIVSRFVKTPNGEQAGVWQAGGAAAADSAGNLFFRL